MRERSWSWPRALLGRLLLERDAHVGAEGGVGLVRDPEPLTVADANLDPLVRRLVRRDVDREVVAQVEQHHPVVRFSVGVHTRQFDPLVHCSSSRRCRAMYINYNRFIYKSQYIGKYCQKMLQ